MTTTRHSFTSIATALAMAAALIAAIGPRVVAEEKVLTLTVTATCDESDYEDADWDPYWQVIDGVEPDGDYSANHIVETGSGGGSFYAEIDPGWKPGEDDCGGGVVHPTGDVSVTIGVIAYDVGGAAGWLGVTGDCIDAPCDVDDIGIDDPIGLTLNFGADVSGEATVTVTLTWTP